MAAFAAALLILSGASLFASLFFGWFDPLVGEPGDAQAISAWSAFAILDVALAVTGIGAVILGAVLLIRQHVLEAAGAIPWCLLLTTTVFTETWLASSRVLTWPGHETVVGYDSGPGLEAGRVAMVGIFFAGVLLTVSAIRRRGLRRKPRSVGFRPV